MDFQKEYQQASEEAATQKWDKARLWAEHIVFCIASIEEIENPWYKKDTDPSTVYQLTLRFIDRDNVTHSVQTTYKVSPEMRILRGRFPAPWHNFKFTRYQTKAGSYGYELAQSSTDDSQCPWERYWLARKEADFTAGERINNNPPPTAQSLTNEYTDGVAEILDGYGFDTRDTEAKLAPITEKTQAAILRACSLMMATFNKRIDPGDFDRMTEGEGQQYLDTLRTQWLTESASKAKTSL